MSQTETRLNQELIEIINKSEIAASPCLTKMDAHARLQALLNGDDGIGFEGGKKRQSEARDSDGFSKRKQKKQRLQHGVASGSSSNGVRTDVLSTAAGAPTNETQSTNIKKKKKKKKKRKKKTEDGGTGDDDNDDLTDGGDGDLSHHAFAAASAAGANHRSSERPSGERAIEATVSWLRSGRKQPGSSSSSAVPSPCLSGRLCDLPPCASYCFTWLLRGKCLSPSCTYAHSRGGRAGGEKGGGGRKTSGDKGKRGGRGGAAGGGAGGEAKAAGSNFQRSGDAFKTACNTALASLTFALATEPSAFVVSQPASQPASQPVRVHI